MNPEFVITKPLCLFQVPGHVELRGAESLRRARLFNRERGDQYLPSQRRDVTYVSRLQSVQAAIDHQLQEMEKEFPNRRVALITFSNEVCDVHTYCINFLPNANILGLT